MNLSEKQIQMAKTSTLLDTTKLLQWAENGLSWLFKHSERRLSRALGNKPREPYHKRVKTQRIEHNKEIAKSQDLTIEGIEMMKQFRTNADFKDRMKALEKDMQNKFKGYESEIDL